MQQNGHLKYLMNGKINGCSFDLEKVQALNTNVCNMTVVTEFVVDENRTGIMQVQRRTARI
jgi:hypothetical protein